LDPTSLSLVSTPTPTADAESQTPAIPNSPAAAPASSDLKALKAQVAQVGSEKIDLKHTWPFIFLHGGCLAVFWVGISPVAVALAVALYVVRMFAITGFYHRYFSHRTYTVNRFWQTVFAIWGMTAIQKGPLWWAAHHRVHHKLSDLPGDIHSPILNSFFWSHIGWIMSGKNMPTDYSRVKDFTKFPELMFINRLDGLIPILYGVALYGLGLALNHFFPQLGTSGPQIFVWGFFISTIALFHGTGTINSLSHVFGTRRFNTSDHSRNNWLLAIITLGEGWHNNHHFYQGATRQGFYWWEYDFTYYVLKVFSWLRIVKNLHPVPAHVYRTAQNQTIAH
jgi:stearoyl-CoA desaturase (delta-9 desaturase)